MAIVINDVAPRARYVATAAQQTFTVPFEFLAITDLKVYRNGNLLTYNAVPANANQYSVTGTGVSGGGTISLGSPYATLADDILILRDMPVDRLTDFAATGAFPISSLNEELDGIIAKIQQIEVYLERRALRLAVTDLPESMSALPVKATRASKLLGFDADGNPDTSNSVSSITALSAQYADEAEASADAAALSEGNASASASAAASSASAASGSASAASASAAAAAASALDAGLNWRSTWVTATAYATSDAVTYNGSTYFCILAHTSGASTQPGIGASWATYWEVLAARGASGSGSGDLVASNNLSDVASVAAARVNLGGLSTLTGTQTFSNKSFSTAPLPSTDDGAALGSTSFKWSDLWLASGAVIDFNSGDVTITHSSNALTWAGATNYYFRQSGIYPILSLDRADTHGNGQVTGILAFLGRDSAAGAQEYARTYGYAQDATAGSEDGLMISGVVINGSVVDKTRLEGSVFSPAASDGTALGSATLQWSDLFLASGGIINWNNGDVSITHAANDLTFSGATSYAFTQSGATTHALIGRIDTHGSGQLVGILSFSGRDDGGVFQVYARQYGYAQDAVNGSEDGLLIASVAIAGTVTDKTRLEGSVFSPAANDGTALGSAGYQWSDLFLASGGVINWNNGAATIAYNAPNIEIGGATNISHGLSGAVPQYFFNRIDNHGSGVDVGMLGFYGRDNAPAFQYYAAVVGSAPVATAGSEWGALHFNTINSGTVANRAYISGGFVVGSPTGADKGAGTINATAVYDDNVLLTCYIGDVVDRATGEPIDIDIDALKAKWDAIVPDRIIPATKEIVVETVKKTVTERVSELDLETFEVVEKEIEKEVDEEKITEIEKEPERVEARVHFGARKFLDRIGTEYDPREIEKAMAHFRDKGHLTSMPNPVTWQQGKMSTGEWIQRLTEQAELSLVWAYREHKRADALEARLAAIEARLGGGKDTLQ
jgi:hypothetical protein